MDTIVLADNEEALSEVTVTGHRSPSIRLENGKLKVNIQHTVLANTGNSIEVLSPCLLSTGLRKACPLSAVEPL